MKGYTKLEVLTPQFAKALKKFLKENEDKREGMFGYTGLIEVTPNNYKTEKSLNETTWTLARYLDQFITPTIQYRTFGLVNKNGKPYKHTRKIGLGGGYGEVAYNATLARYTSELHEAMNK